MLSLSRKILSVSKKVFLVFFVYLAVISAFVYFINKDKPKLAYDPVQKNRQEIYKLINDKKLQKTSGDKLQAKIYQFTYCFVIGEACTNNPADGDKNSQKSLVGILSRLVVTPFNNPPASGAYWAYSSLQNAGFVPKTYAAEGIGFGSIKSFMDIWKVFRDIAYIILVLVIVTIGFMIMFRTKINPQTVLTAENALPRIVVSLILITFSFAIAGFMIDLMYVITAIIISLLSKAGGLDAVKLTSEYFNAGPLTPIGKIAGGQGFVGDFLNIFWKLPNYLANIVGQVFTIILRTVFTVVIFILVGPKIYTFFNDYLKLAIPDVNLEPGGLGVSWAILKAIFTHPISATLAIAGSFIIAFLGFQLFLFLVFMATIIMVTFRIIFLVISVYIRIVLLIIFSPFMALLSSLPGQNSFNFENWLKNLFGELITFPILVTIFVLGAIIINIPASGELFRPPFLASINSEALAFLIGMAILFMAPDLVKTFKEAILPKPMALPSAGLGVFFGGATSALGTGMEQVGRYAGFGYYFKPVGDILNKLSGGNILPNQPHGPPKS